MTEFCGYFTESLHFTLTYKGLVVNGVERDDEWAGFGGAVAVAFGE